MIGYRSVYKSEPKGKSDMLQYTVTLNGAPITATNFLMSNLVAQLKVSDFRNNFNSSLTIGKYVTNCNGLFMYCNNLNKPISVKSVLFPNCSSMLWNCAKFNSPVYIATAENAANMITNCANFNSPVTIGTVNTCPFLLRGCSNFNSTVSIGSAKNLDFLFGGTAGIYNSPFNIPADTTSCNQSFYGCISYNLPTFIPNKVETCYYMFTLCFNLNAPITFAQDSVASNFAGMFANAYNFNQIIDMPNKASNINCAWMFYNSGMNRPTVLPSNVTNCFRMYTFSKMNAPVTLLDGSVVGSCANMFENSVYNQDLIVPERISNFAYALYNDNAFARNIYFKGKTNRDLDLRLCCGVNPAKRKNIFFNIALNSRFSSRYWANGERYPVDWTIMTNGFYNATCNIYCYYNYSG